MTQEKQSETKSTSSSDLEQSDAPRVGDVIRYRGKPAGHVRWLEGNLCFVDYGDGGEPVPFIWKFRDGLNNLHDWPNKPDSKNAK